MMEPFSLAVAQKGNNWPLMNAVERGSEENHHFANCNLKKPDQR
jgi:hypothetical protein